RELDDLREMQRLALASVGDLRAAREPVGDDQRVRAGGPDLGEQHAFPGLDRDLVLVAGLVAERSSEPTASRVEHSMVEAEDVEDLFVAARVRGRALMAVQVHEGALLER